MKQIENVLRNFRYWATLIAGTVGPRFLGADQIIGANKSKPVGQGFSLAKSSKPKGLPYEDKNGMWSRMRGIIRTVPVLLGIIVFLKSYGYSTIWMETNEGIGKYDYIEREATIHVHYGVDWGAWNRSECWVDVGGTGAAYSGSWAHDDGGNKHLSTGNLSSASHGAGWAAGKDIDVYCKIDDNGTDPWNQETVYTNEFMVVDISYTVVYGNLVSPQTNYFNLVLQFYIDVGTNADRELTRLWVNNTGTLQETDDIPAATGVHLYYENGTSFSFDGTESNVVLDGSSGSATDETWGSDALNISIPSDGTNKLLCYVVIKDFASGAIKGRTAIFRLINDGISLDGFGAITKNLMRINEFVNASTQVFVSAPVIITEFNPGTEDWVEIYNQSTGPINIQNYCITDVDSEPRGALAASAVTLGANSYARVSGAAGTDETDATGDTNGNGYIDLYTTIALVTTDEEVALLNAAAVSAATNVQDAVCFTNLDGGLTVDDQDTLCGFYQWTRAGANYAQSDGVADTDTIGATGSFSRKWETGKYTDTNSKNDWEQRTSATKSTGTANCGPTAVTSLTLWNSTYGSEITTVANGDIFGVKLIGTDRDAAKIDRTTVNVKVTAGTGDTTGIMQLELIETSVNSGEYRGTCSVDTSGPSDYSVNKKIYAADSATITVKSVVNATKSDTLTVSANTLPNAPLTYDQYKNDAATMITTGTWTSETTLKIKVRMSDPDASDTLYPCVEIRETGTAFTNSETDTGSGVAYSGSAVDGWVTITLTTTKQYHWQVRVKDAGGLYSSWKIFGGNSDPNDRDVGCDTTAPDAPVAPADTGNTDNYGAASGTEDADGNVTWTWGASTDASGIIGYYIDISTQAGCIAPFEIENSSVATGLSYTRIGCSKGMTYYARIRAVNGVVLTSNNGSASDGIYINRYCVNGSTNDWKGTAPVSNNTAIFSGDEGIWRDIADDNRVDNGDICDLIEWRVAADTTSNIGNLYFYMSFNDMGADNQFVQIAISNGLTSSNTFFIGRDYILEDSFVSEDIPWEYMVRIREGNTDINACNSGWTFGTAGKYSENNAGKFLECAIKMSEMGGVDKFLNQTVNFSVAIFQRDGADNLKPAVCGVNNSNIIDCITDTGPTTWDEVSDTIIHKYLEVTFDAAGNVTNCEIKSADIAPGAITNAAQTDASDLTIAAGGWSVETQKKPKLKFQMTDVDNGTNKYHIQISSYPDFSTILIYYESGYLSTGTWTVGSSSFSVGQLASGGGTYNTGASVSALENATYYWRVWSQDSYNKTSPTTTYNSPSKAFGIDTDAPLLVGAVTATAVECSSHSVTLTWNQAQDTISGVVFAGYILRCATETLTSTNWDEPHVTKLSVNASSGYEVTMSSPGVLFYYAVKAKDNAGNITSAVSGNGSATVQYYRGNCWHIPANNEFAQTMRAPVLIYTSTGVQVQNGNQYQGAGNWGDQGGLVVYYKKSTEGSWNSTVDGAYKGTGAGAYVNNKYWMASFTNSYVKDDIVQYYLKVTWGGGDLHDVTYIYLDAGNSATTGDENVAKGSPRSFTVLNSSPTIPTSAAITPAAPYTTNDLTCQASGASDADGAAITYQFQWRKEGANFGDICSSGTYPSPYAGSASSTTSKSNTIKGEQWHCYVRLYDGELYSPWFITATTVTIQNSAPTDPTSVSVTPASPVDANDLTCTPSGSTDADGDGVTYVYQWYQDDAEMAGKTASTLGNADTSRGRRYNCKVRATDGTANSNWVFSNQVQVKCAAGDIVINELMWMGDGSNTANEWIELRNMLSYSIIFNGWDLTALSGTEGLMLDIPNGTTIAANGYFLISDKNAANCKINVDPDVVDTAVALVNTALQVKIYDGIWNSGGVLIDTADDGAGVPLAGTNSAPAKYSMERKDPPSDGTLVGNWQTATVQTNWDVDISTEKGTPRAVNSGGNVAPVLGHTADNTLGTATQKTDGSGKVDIKFRVKDVEIDNCSFVSASAQYQVASGGWNNIADSSLTFSPSSSTIGSATDWSGTEYTVTWNSKVEIPATDSNQVDFRFKVKDSYNDSGYGTVTGFIVDNTAPTNVGCSEPKNETTTENSISTKCVSLTAVFGNAGAPAEPYKFQIDDNTSFTSPEVSSWMAAKNWDPAIEALKTYYWQVKVRDAKGNESSWCGNPDTAGYWAFKTGHPGITVDGNASDWLGILGNIVNTSVISSGEWIWRDKENEERTDVNAPNPPGWDDKSADLKEMRIYANNADIFFMLKFNDIVWKEHPYISISVDTNQGAETGMNWMADQSGILLGGGYKDNAASHYGERNIIVHFIGTGGSDGRIELYADGGSEWYAPPGAGDGWNSFDTSNEVVEFAIDRTDLGLDGNQTARISVALCANVAGLADIIDTTQGVGTCDALDSISIPVYDDNDYDLGKSAWNEDISDGDIDFWSDIRLDANGIIQNNLPTEPSNPVPAISGFTQVTTPALSWGGSIDSDDGGGENDITSYFLEFANAAFTGENQTNILYRVNLSTCNYTIPSALPSGNYYWRVRARDKTGALSGATQWNFTISQPPNVPAGLAQKETNDTPIATAGWINSTSVKITMTMTDPDASDTLYPCVEIRQCGVVFSNIVTNTGDGVLYTGSGVTGSIVITGLSADTTYHWQARVKDLANYTSGWVAYGGNSDPNDSDFGIDMTAPVVTGLNCTAAPVPNTHNVQITWPNASDTGCGVKSDGYILRRATFAITNTNWDGDNVTTLCSTGTISGFIDGTGAPGIHYYYTVKAADNAGNRSSVYGNGESDVAYILGDCAHLPLIDGYPAGTKMRMPAGINENTTVSIQSKNRYQGGANNGTQSRLYLYYKSASSSNWDYSYITTGANDGDYNYYTVPFINTLTRGATLEYYLKVEYSDNHDITYLCNADDDESTSSTATGDIVGNQVIASTNPFKVVIANRTPQPPVTCNITPLLAQTTHSLKVEASGAYDGDNDNLTYIFEWYKNGVKQTALTSVDSSSPSYTVTISSGNTTESEQWYCIVKASDGFVASAPLQSNTVTIQNAPPTVPLTVAITTATAYPLDATDLPGVASGSIDHDTGDGAPSYVYRWFEDGVEISGVTTATLNNSYTKRGRLYTCQARAFDGTDYSSWGPMSNVVQIRCTINTDIVINELMWPGDVDDAGNEWIELRNMLPYPVVMSGWVITEGNTFTEMVTLPAGTTLPAAGYYLISEKDKANCKIDIDPDYIAGTGSDNTALFTLSNTALRIRLYQGDKANTVIVDDANDNGGPHDGSAGPPRTSMSRNDTPGDGTLAASWYTATESKNWDGGAAEKGSPGAQNGTATAPNAPATLKQKHPTTNAEISVGGLLSSATLTITFEVSDTQLSETLYPYLEIKPLNQGFTDTTNYSGPTVYYTGSAIVSTVTVTGLTNGTSYHWQVKVVDSTDLSSVWVKFGANAESDSDIKIDTQLNAVSNLVDTSNIDNYGNTQGNQDADGNVTWSWSALTDDSGISNYYVDVTTDDFATFVIQNYDNSTTITYTGNNLEKGTIAKIRVRAKDNAGNLSASTTSDGILINRKNVNGNRTDWSAFPTAISSGSCSAINGEGVWSDGEGDQRTDTAGNDTWDMKEWRITADYFNNDGNLYFFIPFKLFTDGQHFVQIAVDNTAGQGMNIFKGRGVPNADTYLSDDAKWEYLIMLRSGIDNIRAYNTSWGLTSTGTYKDEPATDKFIEASIKLSDIGGYNKYIGKSVKFTVAIFDRAGTDAAGAPVLEVYGTDNDSDIVDCISSATVSNTWGEVQDKKVDSYVYVTFDNSGKVTEIKSATLNYEPNSPTDHNPSIYVDAGTTYSTGWTLETYPELTFNISDNNAGEQLKYRIQISKNEDFSSIFIDYLSWWKNQGGTSFKCGQAASSGTYIAGSEGGLSASASYYWRVMAYDTQNYSSLYSSAGLGNVVDFRVDGERPERIMDLAATRAQTNAANVILTWSQVSDPQPGSGLKNYKLYRSLSPDSDFSLIKGDLSAATTTYTDTGTDPDKHYYYRLNSVDNLGQESSSGKTSEVDSAPRKIDGETWDWKGTSPGIYNSATISQKEWIWKDVTDDRRNDANDNDGNPSHPDDADLTEARVTSDPEYLYFLFKFKDVALIRYPYVCLLIDTDTLKTDDKMNWLGDDSGILAGGEYGVLIDTENAQSHYGEYNLIVHNTAEGTTSIEMSETGAWYSPATSPGKDGCYISASNNVVEFKVARKDIGAEGEKRLRFTVAFAVNKTVTGSQTNWAWEKDTTRPYNTSDALDSISILRISSGSLTGQYYNDPNNDVSGNLSSWNQDLSDGNVDFWFDLAIDGNDIIYDTEPSTPTNPSPPDYGNINVSSPVLSWTPSTDRDQDDYVTSYLLEFDDSSISGDNPTGLICRVNVSTNSWGIPSALSLTDGVTYYWRVRARDKSGVLSYPASWRFLKTTNTSPNAPSTISVTYTGNELDTTKDVTCTVNAPNSLDPDNDNIAQADFEFYVKCSTETGYRNIGTVIDNTRDGSNNFSYVLSKSTTNHIKGATFKVKVRIKDSKGAYSNYVETTFIIDNDAPGDPSSCDIVELWGKSPLLAGKTYTIKVDFNRYDDDDWEFDNLDTNPVIKYQWGYKTSAGQYIYYDIGEKAVTTASGEVLYSWTTPGFFDLLDGDSIYVKAKITDGTEDGSWSQTSGSPYPMLKHYNIKISEVRVGTAGDANIFVELYNPMDVELNLKQFDFALYRNDNLGDFSSVKTSIDIWNKEVIPSKGYFLIGKSGLSPTPDAEIGGTIAFLQSGWLYIVFSDTGNINAPNIVDKVGYNILASTPNAVYETQAASSSLTNSLSIERYAVGSKLDPRPGQPGEYQGNGYDSGNNYNDFVYRPIPQPQNSDSIYIEPSSGTLTVWHTPALQEPYSSEWMRVGKATGTNPGYAYVNTPRKNDLVNLYTGKFPDLDPSDVVWYYKVSNDASSSGWTNYDNIAWRSMEWKTDYEKEGYGECDYHWNRPTGYTHTGQTSGVRADEIKYYFKATLTGLNTWYLYSDGLFTDESISHTPYSYTIANTPPGEPIGIPIISSPVYSGAFVTEVSTSVTQFTWPVPADTDGDAPATFRYNFELRRNDPYAGVLIVAYTDIADNYITIPAGVLLPSTNYYWRVKARNTADPDSSGYYGPYCNGNTYWQFSTAGASYCRIISCRRMSTQGVFINNWQEMTSGDTISNEEKVLVLAEIYPAPAVGEGQMEAKFYYNLNDSSLPNPEAPGTSDYYIEFKSGNYNYSYLVTTPYKFDYDGDGDLDNLYSLGYIGSRNVPGTGRCATYASLFIEDVHPADNSIQIRVYGKDSNGNQLISNIFRYSVEDKPNNVSWRSLKHIAGKASNTADDADAKKGKHLIRAHYNDTYPTFQVNMDNTWLYLMGKRPDDYSVSNSLIDNAHNENGFYAEGTGSDPRYDIYRGDKPWLFLRTGYNDVATGVRIKFTWKDNSFTVYDADWRTVDMGKSTIPSQEQLSSLAVNPASGAESHLSGRDDNEPYLSLADCTIQQYRRFDFWSVGNSTAPTDAPEGSKVRYYFQMIDGTDDHSYLFGETGTGFNIGSTEGTGTNPTGDSARGKTLLDSCPFWFDVLQDDYSRPYVEYETTLDPNDDDVWVKRPQNVRRGNSATVANPPGSFSFHLSNEPYFVRVDLYDKNDAGNAHPSRSNPKYFSNTVQGYGTHSGIGVNTNPNVTGSSGAPVHDTRVYYKFSSTAPALGGGADFYEVGGANPPHYFDGNQTIQVGKRIDNDVCEGAAGYDFQDADRDGRGYVQVSNVLSEAGGGTYQAQIPYSGANLNEYITSLIPPTSDVLSSWNTVYLYYRIYATNNDRDPQLYVAPSYNDMSSDYYYADADLGGENGGHGSIGNRFDDPFSDDAKNSDQDHDWVMDTRYGGQIIQAKIVKITVTANRGGIKKTIVYRYNVVGTTLGSIISKEILTGKEAKDY